MTVKPRFTPMDEPEETTAEPQPSNAAIGLILLALQALSQRAIIALTTLQTAAMVASAWWLWHDVKDAPATLQLVWIGMYALFILAIELVRKRK